jgi:acyl carrier protein
MERKEIEIRVIKILRDMLIKEDISLDSPLLGRTGMMDSVAVVRFVQQIEKEFGIGFDDDDLDLDSLANGRTVVDLIMRHS